MLQHSMLQHFNYGIHLCFSQFLVNFGQFSVNFDQFWYFGLVSEFRFIFRILVYFQNFGNSFRSKKEFKLISEISWKFQAASLTVTFKNIKIIMRFWGK